MEYSKIQMLSSYILCLVLYIPQNAQIRFNALNALNALHEIYLSYNTCNICKKL